VNEHLFRSRDDRMIAGVAGGLAELWDADPSLIRIVWALLVFLTGGLALLVYIIMAIVVPEEETWGAGQSAPSPGPAPATPPAPPPPVTTSAEAPGTMAPGDDATVATTASAAAAAAPPPTSAPPLVAPAPEPGAMWAAPPVDAGRAARAEARAARRAARAERRASGGGVSGSMIGGLVLIAIGVFFLAREWLPQFSFDWFWPSMLILLGILLLVAAVGRKPRDPGSSA
jgi:phage shock protein C